MTPPSLFHQAITSRAADTTLLIQLRRISDPATSMSASASTPVPSTAQQPARPASPRLPRPATQASMWISAFSLSSSSATEAGHDEAEGSETVVSADCDDDGRTDRAKKDEGERSDGEDDDDGESDGDDDGDDELSLPTHPHPHPYPSRHQDGPTGRASTTKPSGTNYARPLPKPATTNTTATTNSTTAKGTAKCTANKTRPSHAHDAAQDPASSYTALITFSPPRSSSSYRLHDYVSSSPPRPALHNDDKHDGDDGDVPPVPRVNWPLPATTVGLAAGGDMVGELRDRRAGDCRSAMSLSYGITALPVRYMEEVYRPRPRERVVSAAVGGVVGRNNVKEKKGFRERFRGWFNLKKGENQGKAAGDDDDDDDDGERKGCQAEKEDSESDEGEEQEGEGEGEEIDFLEALRTTSPSKAPRMMAREQRSGGSLGVANVRRLEEGEGFRGLVGEHAEEESEVSRLRRENEKLKRENKALRLREGK